MTGDADVWEFLFLNGEFAPRDYVLAGLTLEQVGTRPAGVPHSTYQELWHTALWQRVVLNQDADDLRRWEQDELFPPQPAPADGAEWAALVESFLADSARAVTLAQDAEWLNAREDADTPGFTRRSALAQLAVHNAYHLGKIVTLRQVLGCWTPRPKPAGPGPN